MLCLIIPHLDLIMEMIQKNIFRPLPVLKKAGAAGETVDEDEEIIIDPAWPHLQVFYLLIHFIHTFFSFFSRFT